MSMKNPAKFARIKLQSPTLPRFGNRQISDAVYAQLRSKAPSATIRDMVNKGAPQVGAPDFALPGMKIEGRLQADHVVSMDRITSMDGFGKLTPEEQLQILNYPDNYIGLSARANASKRDLLYAEWLMHKNSGLTVNPLFTTQMAHMETALARRLQDMIDTMAAKHP